MSEISHTRRITIVGAGMSGTLLANLLARRGFECEIFERAADPRQSEPHPLAPALLTLGERGRFALREAGLEDAVGKRVTALRGRMVHYRSGHTTLQPYGVHAWEALYSIRYHRLSCCLVDAAEASGRVRIHFGQPLESIDWQRRVLSLKGAGEHPFEVLVGADGARSAVRRSMQEAGHVRLREDVLDAGYKQFVLPARADGPPLNPHALHVWPRGGYMIIAMPDTDGSFGATFFLPRAGDHRMPWGFAELDSRVRQEAFMAFNFPDLVPLIPQLETEFRDNPVGRMSTIVCDRWHIGGHGLLLGDAAHNIVPFHGQGVNAAFEDCTALMEILDGGVSTWEQAFAALEQSRREDTEAIAEMALDAFRTMRDSVRHHDFMLRKALERELELRHPGVFVPRYSLVMFHRVPYAEACRRGHVQAGILQELLRGKQELTEVDLGHAAGLISERLTPVAS